MRVVVAGGSGFLGQALVTRLSAKGHGVSVLTRSARAAGDVEWKPGQRSTPWASAVREADVVVNLAGASIAQGRWTTARKALLRGSRLDATGALVREIVASSRPPILISASGVGVYGTRGDELLTEDAAPASDFLADLCRAWEGAAAQAASVTRVVLLRTGLVLSRSGGALPQLARPFWFFAGGPVGSGRQYQSWIHLDDWVSMVEWMIATTAIVGPVNVTAPHPVTNAEFARTLGAAMGRPSFMRMPSLPLQLALGEMADVVILNGQRVIPAKALARGFSFQYSTLDSALNAIYR